MLASQDGLHPMELVTDREAVGPTLENFFSQRLTSFNSDC